MSWKCENCAWENAEKWPKCSNCGANRYLTEEEKIAIQEKKERIKNFQILTIQNLKVDEVFGTITHNLVIGTGIFSDISASFNDFFGSYSSGYQKKLDEITTKSFDNIKAKCLDRFPESNAIIGTHIDYSTMSGNMIMVNIYGTAVKLSQ